MERYQKNRDAIKMQHNHGLINAIWRLIQQLLNIQKMQK